MKRLIRWMALALALAAGCKEQPPSAALGDTRRSTASSTSTIELHVWTTENDPKTIAVLEQIGIELAAKNHAISKVLVTSVQWSELNVKLQQAHQAGRLPAVTHLEPFQTKFFVGKGLLVPVDGLVSELGEEDIHESVRKIAWFDGHYYGIPQHFGVTGIGYRKDILDRAGLKPPNSWEEMLKVLAKLSAPNQGRFAVHYPGGDRFFAEAVFYESLASDGGSVFTADGKPDFTNSRVIETLDYMKKLIAFAPPTDWPTASYVAAFPRLLRGDTVFSLFTAARGTKIFEDQWKKGPDGLDGPDVFVPLEPVKGPSGVQGFASVDCEPYVVMKQSENRHEQKGDAETLERASVDYLRLLYRKDNYIRLMQTVPIHLIPIFKSMDADYSQTPYVKRWNRWYEWSLRMVKEGRVNPFLTTERSNLSIPYLFELYGSKVVSDMVNDVLSGRQTSVAATKIAQAKAEGLARDYQH